MAQRVAIARGLYGKPQVLLLDEPFSAVDAFTRMKLQDLVVELAARYEIAVLLVTHDLDEAFYLSDRVLILGGTPSRLQRELAVPLARPRDRRSAELAYLRGEALTELYQSHALLMDSSRWSTLRAARPVFYWVAEAGGGAGASLLAVFLRG